MVFGQMNEPPGARQRVGLTALTMAEYFRDDEGRDILLFIDNIFRFTQAGSEVSALLGRMPSAVGYQPTLATEMGDLQERITSTKKGSITSLQAIFVPADDYTDPAPATTFGHLDSTIASSGRSWSSASTPAVDPLDVDLDRPRPARRRRRALRRRARGAAHAAALQGPPGHHRHPRHGRADRGGQGDRHAGPPPPALHVPAVLRRRAVHRPPGQVRAAHGDGPRLPARSSRASTTRCPSRRSSWPARSRTWSPRERRVDGLTDAAAAGDRLARADRVFDDEVDMVIVPGRNGQLGILPHHTRLISSLGVGELRIKKGGTEQSLLISGGFVEVRPDKVIVMADLAEHSDEIDEARARPAGGAWRRASAPRKRSCEQPPVAAVRGRPSASRPPDRAHAGSGSRLASGQLARREHAVGARRDDPNEVRGMVRTSLPKDHGSPQRPKVREGDPGKAQAAAAFIEGRQRLRHHRPPRPNEWMDR